MNLIKTLLTLLICFLPLSVSAGELDGKSLVCSETKGNSDYVGDVTAWRFQDGEVLGNDVRKEYPEYKIIELQPDRGVGNEWFAEYQVSSIKVEWLVGWHLIRKTLELTLFPDTDSTRVYQCEVFESFDEYHGRLLEIQSEKQRQLEEELKENKI